MFNIIPSLEILDGTDKIGQEVFGEEDGLEENEYDESEEKVEEFEYSDEDVPVQVPEGKRGASQKRLIEDDAKENGIQH